MSAFTVSQNHIVAVVEAIADGEEMDRTGLGQEILDWNRKAVNERYDTLDDAGEYEHHTPDRAFSDVEILKLIGCIDYQCSDAAGYEDSELHRILQAAADEIIWQNGWDKLETLYAIPGYNMACWTI